MIVVLKHQLEFHLDAADLCKELRVAARWAPSSLMETATSALRDEVIAYVEKLMKRSRTLRKLADILVLSVGDCWRG